MNTDVHRWPSSALMGVRLWCYIKRVGFRDLTDTDPPLLISQILEANRQRLLRKLLHLLAPFDERDGLPVHHFFEADALQIVHGVEPVKVDMINLGPALILVDQDEGRAGDVVLITKAQALGNPLNQRGL